MMPSRPCLTLRWWSLPLIPAPEAECSQPGLQSQFQDSQGHTEKPKFLNSDKEPPAHTDDLLLLIRASFSNTPLAVSNWILKQALEVTADVCIMSLPQASLQTDSTSGIQVEMPTAAQITFQELNVCFC